MATRIVGVPAVRAEMNVGDFDRQKAWIVAFEADEGDQFLADRLGDAHCAPLIHSGPHPRSPAPPPRSRNSPSGGKNRMRGVPLGTGGAPPATSKKPTRRRGGAEKNAEKTIRSLSLFSPRLRVRGAISASGLSSQSFSLLSPRLRASASRALSPPCAPLGPLAFGFLRGFLRLSVSLRKLRSLCHLSSLGLLRVCSASPGPTPPRRMEPAIGLSGVSSPREHLSVGSRAPR